MNPTIISINKCSAINEPGVHVTEDPYGGSAYLKFVSFKNSPKPLNQNCLKRMLNNGMSVFIPEGYSPILIREDDMKKLKTIIEIPELNIHVPALILNNIKRPQNAFLLFRNEVKNKIKHELIKDNPNIRVDNRQISKIAGEKWKTLTELEKAPYKITILKEDRLEQNFDSTAAQASS
ncbi:6640_t:CDS:2, partial [Gigaspora margarita]